MDGPAPAAFAAGGAPPPLRAPARPPTAAAAGSPPPALGLGGATRGPAGHEHRDLPSAPAARGAAAAVASAAAAVLASLSAASRRRRPRRSAATGRRARGGEESTSTLPREDLWISRLDLEGFGREVRALGRRLEKEQGQEDIEHLHKMLSWTDACAAVGLATMWLEPNIVSVLALSLWTHSRWTMIGHHCCHGGYNRTDETGRYSSRGFAIGSLWRRVVDWLDWMLPEAWGVEHNQLHHYRLGERADPDLVERNVEIWDQLPVSKDILTIGSMFTWKWYYYAPNTYKELKVAELRKAGKPLPEGFDPQTPATLVNTFTHWLQGRGVVPPWELIFNVIGPYVLLHFFVLPLPLALINPAFFWHGVANLVLADLVSNFHDFVVIATNHAGEDLYRFERGCKPNSPTFYLRAVVSSANFRTGGDVNDFLHGWLNYQIEHHVWPNLSMLSYQKAQPELQAICERYGVPYIQEDVFTRLHKTYNIFTGRAFMRRFPDQLEREKDIMAWAEDRAAAAAAAAATATSPQAAAAA